MELIYHLSSHINTRNSLSTSKKLIYHFHQNTRYSFIIYPPISTQLIYHLSSNNKLIYYLSFHKNTRYSFIIYISIKTQGTHLLFIVPYQHKKLIYYLSSDQNTRNSFIMYPSIKTRGHSFIM